MRGFHAYGVFQFKPIPSHMANRVHATGRNPVWWLVSHHKTEAAAKRQAKPGEEVHRIQSFRKAWWRY